MIFLKCFTSYVSSLTMLFYIYIGLFTLTTLQFVNCAPSEYDTDETMSSEINDIDTEQSQARYDPRLLSADLSGYHSASIEGASSCLNSNKRYVHGQKISRADPCEICLCVDGEIFCWWKKCERLIRKPPKKPKHHNNRKNKNPWMRNIPKSVLNFPQHLPTQLLDDENFEEDDNSNNNDNIHQTNKGNINKNKEIVTKITSSSTSPSSTPTTMLQEHQQAPVVVPVSIKASVVNIPENVLSSNIHIDTNEPNEHQTSKDINDKLRIITANPIIIDNKITNEAHNGNDGGGIGGGGVNSNDGNDGTNEEKGYYEKTIINKNGVFIENIRKIGNINENLLYNSNNNINNEKKINDDLEENDNEHIKRKLIEQHYLITSSGKIEKTSDPLASDDVIAQFRDGLNDFPQVGYRQQSSTTLETKNIFGENNPVTTAPKVTYNGDFLVVTHNTEYNTATDLTNSNSNNNNNITTSNTDAKPQRTCIVMGQTYNVGTILPQEPGNCLQCICTEGSSYDDHSPRVTCSPHNCPPLILPDLFDATGY